MIRLTVNKPVSEMTMIELAHNCCFAKGRQAFYRDYDREINAREFARELANMFGYELPWDDEEFDYEIMDDLPITEDVSKRELIALFYRNLWAQAELYECLKKYEETGLTPEQIIEIDKLYAEKCRELEDERKEHEWIPCSEWLPEESGKYEVTALDAGRLIVTQVKWQPKLKSWNLTGAMAYWKITAWKPLPEPYRPNKCHGCFGAANNDCERCMDGNEK